MRILFNSDNVKPVLYAFDPPLKPKQLCRVVDGLKGTQADAFLSCPQFGNDYFIYKTKVAEVYDGQQVKSGEFDNHNFRRVALNVHSLLARGLDIIEVQAKRTHELGMKFWPSLRMNDIHKDDGLRFGSERSEWEKQHQDLLIGKDRPEHYLKTHKWTYSWAQDYAKEEVRKRKLDVIEEICRNYDVDGLELDFLRSEYYFKKGQENRGLELMNDFMGKVRSGLDEIGKSKGKTLTLIARVTTHLEYCLRSGLDVPTWIKEGLVDMVVPMSGEHLDMNADLQSFVELAQGTACKIAGGLEFYVYGYGPRWANIGMMRAAASAYWYQGASSIYLFNYDSHGPFPFRGNRKQILEEIGEPGKLEGKDKHYCVTKNMSGLTADTGGDKQLPAELKQDGMQRCFSFTVGDDLAAAKGDSMLKSVRLRLTFDKYDRCRQLIQVRLNEQILKNERIRKNVLVFVEVPAQQGPNDLIVSLGGRNGKSPDSIWIEGIELFIEYYPQTGKR